MTLFISTSPPSGATALPACIAATGWEVALCGDASDFAALMPRADFVVAGLLPVDGSASPGGDTAG